MAKSRVHLASLPITSRGDTSRGDKKSVPLVYFYAVIVYQVHGDLPKFMAVDFHAKISKVGRILF